jgi:hypothetical protein
MARTYFEITNPQWKDPAGVYMNEGALAPSLRSG